MTEKTNPKTNSKGDKKHIFVVSDGTGKTAERELQAGLSQFGEQSNIAIRVFPKITTIKKLDAVIDKAAKMDAMIVHTLVSYQMYARMIMHCKRHRIICVGLLNKLLRKLTTFLEKHPQQKPGLLHDIDQHYYEKIDALGFAVKHDDGQLLRDLDKADIILVGVSRTTKTPTSIVLAGEGWLVSNIPIVMGINPPQALLDIKEKKIVALTSNPHRLSVFRQERQYSMARNADIEYSSLDYIKEEVRHANELYRKMGWPIVDVSNKAVEEIADEVVSHVKKRGERK
jgi:regulator of PEP synthase PpsR (kinase-PPPase family)